MVTESQPQSAIVEKTSRDVVISVFAGLFTGGLIGAPLSVGSYLLWRKVGIKGASRWWAWAATGLIGAPISWAIFVGMVQPSKNVEGSQSATVTKTAQDSIHTGEFKTDKFVYTNVRIAPYTIKNEFAQRQARVAGALFEVTADVQNIGKQSAAPSVAIDVTDSQGRSFKQADFMIVAGDSESGRRDTDYVLPGQSSQNVRLALIDASPDATGFTLTVRDGIFNKISVKPIQ